MSFIYHAHAISARTYRTQVSIKHSDVSPTHGTPITPWQFAQRRVGSRH